MNDHPCIKNCFFIIPKPNSVRIGITAKHAVEIDNPEGAGEFLVSLLNGSRTQTNIINLVRERFPRLSAQEIHHTIRSLYRQHILEDASIDPHDAEKKKKKKWTNTELNRYQRQLSFFNLFTSQSVSPLELQEKIKHATVTLIGLGGAGNALVQALCAIGIGKIRGIDFDRVEDSNLNRQLLFTSQDIGKPKVDVIKGRVATLNPFVTFEAINEKIDTVAKARKYINGSDIVICTADGPIYEIYQLLDRACVAQGIPWISTGVVESTAVVGPFVIPGKSTTYNQYIRSMKRTHPQFLQLVRYLSDTEAHWREKIQPPSFLPMFLFCSSVISDEVVKFLTGMAKPDLLDTILMYDFVRHRIQKKSLTNNGR